MKRGEPLKRSKPLRADVAKVREFLQRGRGSLERSGDRPRARTGFRKATAAEGPLTPAQWRQAAHDASGGRCSISGTRALNADDRRFDAHHPLSKRVLRERRLLGYVWDPRNSLWLRGDVHAAHEFPGVRDTRIPAERLRPSVWEFCAELDALEGTQWATQLVLRAHPPAGFSRISQRRMDDGS